MAGLRYKLAFKRCPEYADAICALNLGASFSVEMNDYSTLKWYSPNIRKPTEDEIKAKLDELMVEYEKQKYKLDRYMKYLTVEEQLNQLWDDMNSGIIPGKEDSAWFQHIKEIKESIPKPPQD